MNNIEDYNIAEYFKGKNPLNEREEVLFELINIIDKESFNLFCEIVDLDKIMEG